MKPVTSCRIYFHQPVNPDGKQYYQDSRNYIVKGIEAGVLDNDEQRKDGGSEIGHHDELVLVDGAVLLFFVEKVCVELVAEQFEDVCDEQQRKKNANIRDEGQFRHGAGNVGGAEHDQSGGDGEQVEEEHERGNTVFENLALALDDGEMALGEQGAVY